MARRRMALLKLKLPTVARVSIVLQSKVLTLFLTLARVSDRILSASSDAPDAGR
jgi:hypothetical protein